MRLITAFGCCLLLATFVTTSPDVSHLKYSRRPYKKLLVTTTAIPNTKSDAIRKESTYTFKPRILIRKGIRNGKLTTAMLLPTTTSTPVTETVATQSTTVTSPAPTTTNRPRMRTTENDDILSVIDNSDSIRSDGADGKRSERDGTSLQDAWDIRHNIPGEPGVDYPIYFQAPDSKFDCENRHDGYYADTEARCQVFHVCANTALEERGFIFLCPNGTVFSQESFVCDWYTNVNCPESEKYYYKNEELGRFIGSKEEMLLEVQKMFDYTLRNLLNTKPNTNQNGGKESNDNGNDIGSENSIAGDESLDQKFGNFSAIPILNPKMRKTGNASKGKGKTSKDEVYISNLGELSTDPGADFDINVVKQQAKLKAEAAIKSKAGSFAELWGQDIEQLDEILSQNRLKKSSDGNLFIDVSIPSVTPAASTVTKRDVSHLLTTPEYIPPNRYLPSLRKINLRPPGGYHYEPGPQTYVSNSNPSSAVHRNVQQQIPGIVITPSIGQSLGHVVTQGPSAPQKVSLTKSTVNQGLPPLKISTEHSVFQQQNKLRPIVVPDSPLRVVTQRPIKQQQTFISSQQEIGGLQGGQARQPLQEQYQYTFPNQQRPQFQQNTNHFVQSPQQLHEFQTGQALNRPPPTEQFLFGTEQHSSYNIDATGPGGENVIVNIVPSINWYLNDARDRNSYFSAIQRGLVPSENLQFNQGHLRYGTPLEYQNHNSFGQQYPIGGGGRHIGQSFSRRIDAPSTHVENANRRIDNANVVLPVDKGMDAVFRGFSSYNAPIGSIGKLPCDSDSVSGQS